MHNIFLSFNHCPSELYVFWIITNERASDWWLSPLISTELGSNWASQLPYKCIWRARCKVNIDHNGSSSQPCQTWCWHPIRNPSKIFHYLYSENRHKFFHIANQQKLTVVCIDLLQVRTHFARPNWKEVFTKIASKHPYATVGKDTLLKHRIVNTEPYALMHANWAM